MKTQTTTPEGVQFTNDTNISDAPLKLSFVCLDTETTGLDDSAEIIEVAWRVSSRDR